MQALEAYMFAQANGVLKPALRISDEEAQHKMFLVLDNAYGKAPAGLGWGGGWRGLGLARPLTQI